LRQTFFNKVGAKNWPTARKKVRRWCSLENASGATPRSDMNHTDINIMPDEPFESSRIFHRRTFLSGRFFLPRDGA
jgi:hypothetical protein